LPIRTGQIDKAKIADSLESVPYDHAPKRHIYAQAGEKQKQLKN
jgi:hypothetical protein